MSVKYNTGGMIDGKIVEKLLGDSVVEDVSRKVLESGELATKEQVSALSTEVSNLSEDIGELSDTLADKMEFYKVNLQGTKNNYYFTHTDENGTVHRLTYNDLKSKYQDDKYFLFCEWRSVTFIPSLPPDYDPSYDSEVIEFSATWDYMNEHRITTIKINSNGEIKADEFSDDFLVADKNYVDESVVQIKEDLSELKNGFNILSPNDWEKGYINSSGVNTSGDRYERTAGYYEVSSGQTYTITVGNGCGVTFRQYDSSKTYKSQQTVNAVASGTYTTKTLTIPSGISYIRITVIPIDTTTYAGHITSKLSILYPYTGVLSPNKFGVIISSPYNKKQVTVDSVQKTITFSETSGYCYVLYGNKQADIRGKVVDYSSIETSYGYIFFDFATNEFVLKDASISNISKIGKDQVYIGYIWNSGKSIVLNVKPYYVVNGVKTTESDHNGVFDKYWRMSVLGDSISTYEGYTESGLYEEYYPKNDVDSVEKTWWKMVANALRIQYVSVSAVSSSQFNTVSGTERPPLWDDNRITRLGQYGNPNIVFVNGGTNDPFTNRLGTNAYHYSIADIEAEAESTIRGCSLTIRKIQNSYPNARIIGLIPKFVDIARVNNATYTFEAFTKVCNGIKDIYEQYGCEVIDLRECGINCSNVNDYTIDGIHPNSNGMKLIADYIISKLIK